MNQDEVIDLELFNTSLENFQLPPLKFLNTNSSVADAITLMQEQNFGSVMVEEEGETCGIITERDLIEHFLLNGNKGLLADVMTKDPMTLSKSSSVSDCIQLMCQYQFRHIPISDDQGKVAYMLSIHDILKFIIGFFPNCLASHGALFKWSRDDVQTQEESFSFNRDESRKGKISSNIFLSSLDKLLYGKTVKVDKAASLKETMERIHQSKSGAAIITKYETIVEGIVTERDLLKKAYGYIDLEKENPPISKFMTPDPHCLFKGHILAQAINNMFQCHYRHIILVDEEKFPLGIISLQDILSFLKEKIFPST